MMKNKVLLSFYLIILCACQQKIPESDEEIFIGSSPEISQSTLTQKEEFYVTTFADGNHMIYEYTLPNEIKQLKITIYELKISDDMPNWEVVIQKEYPLEESQGSLAIEYALLNDYKIGVLDGSVSYTITNRSEATIRDFPSEMIQEDTLMNQDIKINEEIPLIIQSVSSTSLARISMRDFYDTSKLPMDEESKYYAFTVMFE